MRQARYIVILLLLLSLFFAVNIYLFIRFIKLGNEPLYAILFLGGINLNLLALLTLFFYVGKSLLRLYIDRKRGVPGHRFQIQLVSIFVILTLIPGIFLFIIGSGLVTGYIDRWMTPQGLSSLERSLTMARTYYEDKKALLKSEGLRLRDAIDRTHNSELVAKLTVPLPHKSGSPEKWEIIKFPDDDLTREAFLKGESSDILKTDEGEYIRIALRSEKGILKGALKISPEITEAVDKLKKDYEELSLKLRWKFPLKINFVMTFGFFTLLIIMLALWTGLKISKRITVPVAALTEATMAVASGNLDVQLKTEQDRNDEIGYLVKNFNFMIEELKNSKEELHKAYRQAEEQRIRLSSILEHIQTGVLFIDSYGAIVSINKAAEKILGISQEGFLGRNYKDLLYYIGSEELDKLIKGIRLRDLKGIEKEIRLTIKERSLILRVFITGLRIPDKSGEVTGLIVVFDDITDIVNAQKAMAWQEIAAKIAHEVKNPLTPIKLSTERLIKKWQQKDSDFGEVFESSTRTIIREVESLRRLVSDFSQFGRMPQIKKSPVDLREILKELYNLYTGFKDIRMHLELPPQEVVVEVDPEQMKRVFINIVDNAIEAIKRGDVGIGPEVKGNIYINLGVDYDADKVMVTIADDGPGISDDIKDKLFMPHFTTKKGGSGLGLAIANRIVTEHMGLVKVKDNKPNGAVFIIEIPLNYPKHA